MKIVNKFILSFLCILITFSLNAQLNEFNQSNIKFEYDFKTFTLDNGLKVVVVEDNRTDSVLFQLSNNVDPVYQKNAVGYISMTQMLFQFGTDNKSKTEIEKTLNNIGAKLYTNNKGIYGVTLSKHKEAFLEVLSEIIKHPSFPEEEVEKLKKQAISSVVLNNTNDQFIAERTGQKIRNGNHPYAEIITKESIQNITQSMIVDYYNSYYKPNVSFLVIVGNVTLEQVQKDVQKYFGSWGKGKVNTFDYQFPSKSISTRVALVHKENAQKSYINITHPVNFKIGDKDEIPAKIANEILGRKIHSISRLNEEIGFEDSKHSELIGNPLVGYFSAYAEANTEMTEKAIDYLILEMKKINDELVNEELLNQVKKEFSDSLFRSLKNVESIADFAMNTLKYSLPINYYQKYFERIQTVTPEQIRDAAQKFISPDNAVIIIVGDKYKLLDSLKRYSSTGKVELYDVDGNIFKDDRKSLPDGISTDIVINKYIEAIGGKQALEQIEDVTIVATTKMNGMEIKQKTYKKTPNKYAMIISMNGNIMMQQSFNGERAIMKSYQGEQEIIGKDLENIKIDAAMNIELKYKELGVDATLVAVETVNNKDAYKVKIVNPTGKTVYDYYDLDTGLKIQTKQSIVTAQGEFTQNQSYLDYQEINGVKFPFILNTSGVQNMELKVDSVLINTNISDESF